MRSAFSDFLSFFLSYALVDASFLVSGSEAGVLSTAATGVATGTLSVAGASAAAVSTTTAGASLLLSRFAALRALILAFSSLAAARRAAASSIPGSTGLPLTGVSTGWPTGVFPASALFSAGASLFSEADSLTLWGWLLSCALELFLAFFLFFLSALLSARRAFASAMPGSIGRLLAGALIGELA